MAAEFRLREMSPALNTAGPIEAAESLRVDGQESRCPQRLIPLAPLKHLRRRAARRSSRPVPSA